MKAREPLGVHVWTDQTEGYKTRSNKRPDKMIVSRRKKRKIKGVFNSHVSTSRKGIVVECSPLYKKV